MSELVEDGDGTSPPPSKYFPSSNGLMIINKNFNISGESGIKNTTASVIAPATNVDADFEYSFNTGKKMVNIGNTSFNDEIEFFNDNLAIFLNHETLTNYYVAIFNQQIIDKDLDRTKLMKRVYAKEGYKPILFKKVTSEKKFVRLRSPKLR